VSSLAIVFWTCLLDYWLSVVDQTLVEQTAVEQTAVEQTAVEQTAVEQFYQHPEG
jgi:hypothetical protein